MKTHEIDLHGYDAVYIIRLGHDRRSGKKDGSLASNDAADVVVHHSVSFLDAVSFVHHTYIRIDRVDLLGIVQEILVICNKYADP